MGLGAEGGECDPSGFDPQGRWTCVATIDGGPIKKIIGRGRMQSPPRCTKDAALSAAEKWRRQGKARKWFCGLLFLHRPRHVDGGRIEEACLKDGLAMPKNATAHLTGLGEEGKLAHSKSKKSPCWDNMKMSWLVTSAFIYQEISGGKEGHGSALRWFGFVEFALETEEEKVQCR